MVTHGARMMKVIMIINMIHLEIIDNIMIKDIIQTITGINIMNKGMRDLLESTKQIRFIGKKDDIFNSQYKFTI